MTPIKIECACGQHYAFEIEPVDGGMPAPVACPACGADGTPAANQKIAQYLKAWSEDEPTVEEGESEEKSSALIPILSVVVILAITGVAGAFWLKHQPQFAAKTESTNAPASRVTESNQVEVAIAATGEADPAATPGEAEAAPAAPEPAQSAAVTQQPAFQHNFAAWPAFIHSRLGTNNVGGYAFVVRQNGKIVAGGTGGYARMLYEKEHPGLRWTLTKPMPVASVSKLITAAGLVKLWEEKPNSFSFDDPFWPLVQDIFPEVHSNVRQITIRQLLTHRSGLTQGAEDRKKAALILALPLATPPGQAQHYNNLNFFLARLVLEKLSGEPYTQYIRGHLLQPAGALGMDTKYEAVSQVLAYTSKKPHLPGYPFAWDNSGRAGASGWYGSAADLTSFTSGLGNGRVLSAASAAKMFQERLGCWAAYDKGQIIGYHHNGAWSWDTGKQAGTALSGVVHFVDGVDAALLINSNQGDAVSILTQAWHLRAQEKVTATNAPAAVEK